MNDHTLKISYSAIELLKKQQGLSLEKYRDEKGLWVIGYGHVIRPWENFSSLITPLAAEIMLQNDLQIWEALLRENIKQTLTQQQHDTLISLLYSLDDISVLKTTVFQAIIRV
jgi:Phage-related lysozyme (muraminidase)